MSWNPRRRGARALASVVGALVAAAPLAGAAATTVPDGAIEVSYTDVSEIRPGEGWTVDCSGIAPLEGIDIACTAEGLTLTSRGFDADLGVQTLIVPQTFGVTRIEVRYRVRLEPPPPPEVGVTRFDLPIAVGEQALVPLAALAVSCAACTEDGGATVRVEEPPAGVVAGVGPTHLSLRGSAPGDAVIPLVLTDDAGQSVEVELTVTFVPASETASGALHVAGDPAGIALGNLVWGEGMVIVCSPTQAVALRCTEDGGLERLGEGPAQLLFRAVDAEGRLHWGSVTAADDAPAPVASSWAQKAPLEIVSAPLDAPQEETAAPLAALARLLEGIPAS